MTSSSIDRDGEVMDYDRAKKEFQSWSRSQHEATLGRSYGNVRDMHTSKVIGVLTSPLQFDDQGRKIYVHGQVIDPQAKDMLEAGCYGGLSIGGSYQSRTPITANGKRVESYVPEVAEVSLVDRPSNRIRF